MPLTKQVFSLWNEHLTDVNADLIQGRALSDNDHVTLMNYASILGYNKAAREFQNFAYEDLVEVPVEPETESENV